MGLWIWLYLALVLIRRTGPKGTQAVSSKLMLFYGRLVKQLTTKSRNREGVIIPQIGKAEKEDRGQC